LSKGKKGRKETWFFNPDAREQKQKEIMKGPFANKYANLGGNSIKQYRKSIAFEIGNIKSSLNQIMTYNKIEMNAKKIDRRTTLLSVLNRRSDSEKKLIRLIALNSRLHGSKTIEGKDISVCLKEKLSKIDKKDKPIRDKIVKVGAIAAKKAGKFKNSPEEINNRTIRSSMSARSYQAKK